MTELNDELLVAYVDGQLAENQSKAVERVLEEDMVAAQRVEALRSANAHLETAFEAMLAGEPIPVPAAEGPAAGRLSRLSLVRRAALFAWIGLGCLLGGGAAGYVLSHQIDPEPFQRIVVTTVQAPPQPVVPIKSTWPGDVARIHALLSPETFAFGLESEGNMDLTGFQISKTLGASMTVPDLSSENLTFQRAQLLQRDGKPFAQIAYMTQSGTPVALYATPFTGKPEALTLDEKDGIGLASWTQGGLSLLFAGDVPEARLQSLAQAIESRLAANEPKAQDTGTPVTAPVDPDAAGSAPE